MPDGQYEVTLHFSRVVKFPVSVDHRLVDVRLNGQTVLSEYLIGESGLGEPDVHRFEVTVDRGVLELEFEVNWRAYLAAIEVRRLPTAR